MSEYQFNHICYGIAMLGLLMLGMNIATAIRIQQLSSKLDELTRKKQ